MKKIFILVVLIFALILSACDFVQMPNGDTSGDIGSGGNENGGGTEDNGNGSGNTDSGNGSGAGGGATDSHKHTDDNGDKVCDVCSVATLVLLDVFGINDMHGKLFDTDDNVGVDELTTYFEAQRSSNENTLILSAGDMWQGTYESNLTKGFMMTEWLNAIGCAAMTLGNHEFDWGEEIIAENETVADFPLLAINIFENESGNLADYCTPSVVVEFDGYEIGIIGAIGDCYSSISPDKVTGVHFKVGSELSALVKAEAERLRGVGVDFIIYSLHDGNGSSSSGTVDMLPSAMGSYYDASLSDGYVDLVFEGHSHQRYVHVDKYGVYHLQGGGDNSGITHAEVYLDLVTGEVSVSSAESLRANEYASYDDSPIVDELAEKYSAQISRGEEYLGTNRTYLNGDAICDIAAQLYAAVGESYFTDYNVVLGGGYLSARSPYEINAGKVYYKDIYGVLPFDNDLVLCSIRGSDLLSKFINTSNSNYHIGYTSYGNSIKNSISQSATYYIVTDTYSAYYAPNRLTVVEFYTTGIYARDLFADYVKAGGIGEGVSGGTEPAPDPTPDSGVNNVTYPIISIAQANEIANSLEIGGTTADSYYVLATVTQIVHQKYGNMYITDSSGNSIYVYGVYGAGGELFETFSSSVEVGDTVLLRATIKRYLDTATNEVINEMFHAELVLVGKTVTVTEALNIGAGLSAGESTEDGYFISGTVAQITNDTYGNLTITDDSGNTLLIYGTYSADGTVRYDSFGEQLEVGDRVTYYGMIYRYVNASGTSDIVEIQVGWLICVE